MRAASSAALREQVRVRSFRDVLVATTLVMSLLAIAIADHRRLRYPTLLPALLRSGGGGSAVVVCPTQQSAPFSTAQPGDHPVRDVRGTSTTRSRRRCGRGISARRTHRAGRRRHRGGGGDPEDPRFLGALRGPARAGGAETADRGVTAFLGLLLMRGQFVPGLSALDTLGADLGLGSRLRVRAAAVHPAGRPAGPDGPEQRPRGEQGARRQHSGLIPSTPIRA